MDVTKKLQLYVTCYCLQLFLAGKNKGKQIFFMSPIAQHILDALQFL